jgi:hypothetical protein
MDLENKIRQTLEHGAPQPPVFEGWEGLQRRARRDRIKRGVGAVVAVAMLAAAVVSVTSRLNGDEGPTFAGEPTELTDPAVGYTMTMPKGWSAPTERKGGDDVSVTPALSGDLTTSAWVQIHPEQPRSWDEMSAFQADKDHATGRAMKIAGQRAIRYTLSNGGGLCRPCEVVRTIIEMPHRWVLQIDAIAGTSAPDADVAGLLAMVDGMTVIPTTFAERHGTMGPEVVYTEAAKAVAGFLESRVTGEDPASWITDAVAADYARTAKTVGLATGYGRPYLLWRIYRATTDGDATVFQIGITTTEEVGETFLEETLTVRRAEKPAIVERHIVTAS